MKNNYIIALLAVVATACNKQFEEIQIIGAEDMKVGIYAPGFVKADGTKSSLSIEGSFSWSSGDRIGLFSHRVGSTTQAQTQLALTLASGEGTSTAYSETTGWALVQGGAYDYVSYYPYSETNTRNNICIDYTGQTQTANNSTANLGAFDYMYSNPSFPVSASEATFSFNHIGSLVNVHISVPSGYEHSTFYQMRLYAESKVFAYSASYSVESIISNGVPSLTRQATDGLNLSFGLNGIKPVDGIIDAWMLMLPSEIGGQQIKVKLYAEKNDVPSVEGNFTAESDQCSGNIYSYSVTSSPSSSILPDKPMAKDTLHVLLFGHSFGGDCLEYLAGLASAAGIDNVYIGLLAQANCSLSQHWGHILDKDKYGFNYSNSRSSSRYHCAWSGLSEKTDVILAKFPWDIIVFQQSIGFNGEGNYSSYQPDLNYLTKYVSEFCKKANNKVPVIGWNMFWGFNSGHQTDYDHDATTMYNAIVQATNQMMADNTDIQFVIPSGTGMQNARGTSLNTSESKLFTRDGYHASVGIGRYVAAATWFQSLIAPIYGVDVTGNLFSGTSYSFTGDEVTDAKKVILQKCAVEAVNHPYEVTPIVEN